MPGLRLIIGSILLLSVAQQRTIVPSPTPACRGPDAYTMYKVSELRRLMHTTDSLDSHFRQKAGLPLVTDSEISIVTDSTTCARAVAAYNLLDTTQVASSMYVFQVGSVYVASNPDAKAGEWVVHYVFDDAFHLLKSFLD